VAKSNIEHFYMVLLNCSPDIRSYSRREVNP
jgi:hypothetical protein